MKTTRRLIGAICLTIAAIPAAAQDVYGVDNVRGDEDGDGVVTMSFSPEDRRLSLKTGATIQAANLAPFGLSIRANPFDKDAVGELIVQRCDPKLFEAQETGCASPSGDKDGYVAATKQNKIYFAFDPPITSLSFAASSSDQSQSFPVYLSLLDKDGKNIGGAKVLHEGSGQGGRAANNWNIVEASDTSKSPYNRVVAAAIDFEGSGGRFTSGLLDTIRITRQLNKDGKVMVAAAPSVDTLATWIEKETSENSSNLVVESLISNGKDDAGRLRISNLPEKVLLKVDWESARAFNRQMESNGIALPYVVSETKIQSVEVPLLLPASASADPLMIANKNFYYATTVVPEGELSVSAKRIVSKLPGELNDSHTQSAVSYMQTETGWAASFQLFGIPYLVLLDCDAAQECPSDAAIQREVNALMLAPGSRGAN